MGTMNYYEILGVGRDADDDAVKQAFRERAKECHPDLNPGDAKAAERFKHLNTAYEALKEESRREAYNEWLTFAEMRERSGATQWARIAALVAVLAIAPVVLLLIFLAGDWAGPLGTSKQAAGTHATGPQATDTQVASPQRPAGPQTAAEQVKPQPAPSTSRDVPQKTAREDAAAGNGQHSGSSVKPKTNAAKPHEDAKSAAKLSGSVRDAPRELGGAPGHASETTGNKAAARDPAEVAALPQDGQVTPARAPQARLTPSPDAGQGVISQVNDCEGCPVMGIYPADVQNSLLGDRNKSRTGRDPVAISRSDISVAEWNVCVADGACPRYNGSGADPHRPVRDIGVREAEVFVRWLSRKTGHVYRVLTGPEPAKRVAEAEDGSTPECTGWEWLADNPRRCARPGLSRGQQTDAVRSFRVFRPLKPVTD